MQLIAVNPSQYLDKTLEFLFNGDNALHMPPRHSVDMLIDKFHKSGINIDLSLMNSVLIKLRKDGYTENSLMIGEENTAYLYPPSNVPCWYITFEGMMFLEKGAYTISFEMEQYQKKIQTQRDFLLISGSWFAGLAASGLLYVEFVNSRLHLKDHILKFSPLIGLVLCFFLLNSFSLVSLKNKIRKLKSAHKQSLS